MPSSMTRISRDRRWGSGDGCSITQAMAAARCTRTREILGPEPLLLPAQMVVLSDDADKARVHRPTASSYANNALQSGFSTDDIDTLSDQLVDALITWGDEDAIIRRIDQQFDAGADHIPLIVLTDDTEKFPMDQWRRLATAFDGRYR
jgi:alkanesulfonate monooxygenase SsuD/methylene tetrahydromethanopterin reductase-like flavin-dependent oxidoreductase (luciferase family)